MAVDKNDNGGGYLGISRIRKRSCVHHQPKNAQAPVKVLDRPAGVVFVCEGVTGYEMHRDCELLLENILVR